MTNSHQLPYDVARCVPEKRHCGVRRRCARFTSEWNDGRQEIIDATVVRWPDGACPMFVDNGTNAPLDYGRGFEPAGLRGPDD